MNRYARWARYLGSMLLVAAWVAGCGGGSGSSEESTPASDARAEAQIFGHRPPATNGVSVYALLPVAVRPVSRTMFEFDYRLVLRNTGPAVADVAVQLVGPERGVQVVDGLVSAGTLPANSYTVPPDKITIRKGLFPLFILRPHEWLITFGPPTIAGTAAVGAALANGEVSVTDATGASACAETTIVTTGTGGFTCTVQAGRTAPFVVVVSDPFKAYPPLVSIVPAAPAPGTTLVANATPITTAIVAQLAPNGDALSVLSNRSLIDLAALSVITANVLTQIQPVLTALGAPAGYDPFTTQIVAGTITQAGNTADQVIEALRFTTVNGVPTVSTVDNPTGGVPLAGATTTNPPQLPPPSPALVGIADALRQLTSGYTSCFALPVAARVLAFDASIPITTGGPEVTGLGGACANLAHPTYLNNGYRFGQRLAGLLNDPTMVGAAFSPAEVMLFQDDTSAADNDVVVVNQRFVDANGVASSLIDLLRKLPGSATVAHPSDWWPYGNQQVVDSRVRAFVRRQQQQFVNAGSSRFETGIELFVNKDGPGSTALRAARLTGPGLPPAGLVYTRPNAAIITDQTWLNIRRKDGLTDPAFATPAADVGNIFRLQRTQGLVGTAPLPVQPNPNEGNTNNTAFPQWAHPLDYGVAVGTPATGYIDFSALKANTSYTLELFYDGDTAPRYTYVKTMLTPVVPATYAVNLRWLELTAPTLSLLDPTGPLAGSLTTAALAWNADPFVETVSSAGFYTFSSVQTVNDSLVGVPRGATTATAVAPAGFGFQSLTADGTSGRTIQLRYLMLDGSYKDSTWRFN